MVVNAEHRLVVAQVQETILYITAVPFVMERAAVLVLLIVVLM